MYGNRWNRKEELELFSLIRKQLELSDIASMLGRTELAVRKKLTREGFVNKSIWIRNLNETSEL